MKSGLTQLEEDVLSMLVKGEDDVLAMLREQIRHSQVISRRNTGVGFYTNLSVSSHVAPIPGDAVMRIGDVYGSADNILDGVGFVLFVDRGKVSMLEGYTYDEPWPPVLENYQLKYSTGEARDMDALFKVLHP